jgi:hypothetical protein
MARVIQEQLRSLEIDAHGAKLKFLAHLISVAALEAASCAVTSEFTNSIKSNSNGQGHLK